MLINLSNHPFDEWDSSQKKQAIALYSEVVDIPFPEVPPEADSHEIEKLADEYLNKIKAITEKKDVVVHIMGEMTFCYTLIHKLQRDQIKCIASTTKRDVRRLATGEKVMNFNFVQFREYNMTT